MRKLLHNFPLEFILLIGSLSIYSSLPAWQTASLMAVVVFLVYLVGYRRTIIDNQTASINKFADERIEMTNQELILKEANADCVKSVEELTGANAKYANLIKSQTVQLENLHLNKKETNELESRLIELTDKATQTIQALLDDIQTLRQSDHTIDLTCAYCSTVQPVLFDVTAGEFTCRKCDNINAVHTNIYTARTNTLLK